jgi:hypothetical protein
LASDLSAPITGHQFSLTAPGNVVREMYVASQTVMIDQDWTPQLLAERSADIVHQEEAFFGLRIPTLTE